MTEEMLELGRRAVACKGWRWLPGMLTLADTKRERFRIAGEDWPYLTARADSLPDFTDAATLGCVVALLRELRNEPHGHVGVLSTAPVKLAWVSGLPVAEMFRLADSEVEALVLTLEKS